MVQRGTTFRGLAALLAGLFLAVTVWLPAAQASMIDTRSVAGAEELEQTREEVLALLEREEVRDRLVSWGVDPEDAEARVHALTAAELEELSARMDEQPAGAGVGSVVGAAVFVFLVLLITDILGFTNVFPFVERTVR
ncbi:PA2779 family protein [Aquisalimonas lutea]|uniref:PA2779 family protein n=1 Tax=Aquisalimonas lutea TaxID=1327750 RepID=UPI0025B4562A|nr:PA2779 family protein [Aquisalimonas lutea]MDN3517946.1 PA2779 family protein [Aquisalimonas lutea]